MHAALALIVLIACGGDPPRPRPVTEGSSTPPDARVAEPRDAQAASAVIDAVQAAPVDAAMVQCFCFSWVHLDENGESCYPAKATCDTEFRAFGRDMKIACKPEQRPGCGSYACRGVGAECFRL
jgi:hypothetical protein